MNKTRLTSRKWFYPLIYGLLVIVSFLPPITEVPYDPRNTPVFLFLLILSYPKVPRFALRVTAFNGLIYGLLNLTHWFNPDTVWMGVMHIPLLVMPLAALFLPRLDDALAPDR